MLLTQTCCPWMMDDVFIIVYNLKQSSMFFFWWVFTSETSVAKDFYSIPRSGGLLKTQSPSSSTLPESTFQSTSFAINREPNPQTKPCCVLHLLIFSGRLTFRSSTNVYTCEKSPSYLPHWCRQVNSFHHPGTNHQDGSPINGPLFCSVI